MDIRHDDPVNASMRPGLDSPGRPYRLCYQLPRYALEWIGGSPTQLGEEGDQERMTAAFFLAFQRQLRPSPTGRATSTAKNALAKVADERSGSGNDAGKFADKIG